MAIQHMAIARLKATAAVKLTWKKMDPKVAKQLEKILEKAEKKNLAKIAKIRALADKAEKQYTGKGLHDKAKEELADSHAIVQDGILVKLDDPSFLEDMLIMDESDLGWL